MSGIFCVRRQSSLQFFWVVLGSQSSSQWWMLSLLVPAELNFGSWPLFQEATLTVALAFWMTDDSWFGFLSFPSGSNTVASTWNMERPCCSSASKRDLRRMSPVWKFRGKTDKQIIHVSMPCSKIRLYIAKGWQSVIANTAHTGHFARCVTVLHVL